ncbi:AAA-ATPase At3g50940-like [Punica granatum]|nr:AAA-ATPase At3g50940-like [Punica granatum]
MLSMSKRSILTIEDIDCSTSIHNRDTETESSDPNRNKVMLSGLLNSMDGLLSCCGEARIIVLTTNHKERLDPALLRPGRMDMHICLSYCSIPTFKELTFNYLGLRNHHLFHDIEEVIGEAKVTPAEVAGGLMKSRNVEASLQGLVTFLHNKIAQRDAA